MRVRGPACGASSFCLDAKNPRSFGGFFDLHNTLFRGFRVPTPCTRYGIEVVLSGAMTRRGLFLDTDGDLHALALAGDLDLNWLGHGLHDDARVYTEVDTNL